MTEEKKTEFRDHYATLTGRMNNIAPAVAYISQSLASQQMAGRAMRVARKIENELPVIVTDYAELERRALAYYDNDVARDLAEWLAPAPTERQRTTDEQYVAEGRNEANRTQRRAERRYLDMKRPKGNRR